MNYTVYKNKKILITGANGFKGSWLSFILNKYGAKVYGLGIKNEKDSYLFNALRLNKNINFSIIDINNFDKVNQYIKHLKPDFIFHLAAQSIVSESYNEPLDTFKTNIIGSANILESFYKSKIEGMVYVTSDKSYENKEWVWGYRETDNLMGSDPYSCSKSCADLILNSYIKSYNINSKKIRLASARGGNVIGGGDTKKDRIIPDLVKCIISKKNIILRNPQSVRPWQHVFDISNGYLTLGERMINKNLKTSLASWNFGPDNHSKLNVRSLTKNFIKIWGSNIKIHVAKKNFKETNYLHLNCDKSKRELNWKSKLTQLDCLNYTVDWYKNFYHNNKNIYNFSNDQFEKFISK